MKQQSRGWPYLMLFTVALLAVGVAPSYGATIYVNGSNVSSVTNGLTPDTGWKTIADGLDNLAATNALTQGGHTLVVGAGTYAEEVVLVGPSSGGHSGVSGNPNLIRADGEVLIDGEWSGRDGIELDTYCYHMHVDGFTITGARWGINECGYYHSISNVTIYDCHGGIALLHGNSSFVGNINRCTIVGNEYAGIYSADGGGTVVRDSIVAFNGIGCFEGSTSGDVALRHCVLYGNGVDYIDEVSELVTTKEAIEALPGNPFHPANVSTGLVMQAPGYIRLGSDFDPALVYDGAPIFSAGADGGIVGALPAGDYTTVTVPLSSATYYVAPPPTGDDGRNAAEAQNSATPWATIQRAAAAAAGGDTVVVAAGTYAEGVSLTNACPRGRAILFQADGDVTVDGTGQGAAVSLSGVNDLVFDGFVFANATHGALLESAYGVAFTNCHFRDNAQDGLNALDAAGAVFQACDFSGNGYRAVNLYPDSHGSCQGFSFYDCNMYSNRPSNNAWGVVEAKGAYLLTLDRCRIFDNDANNNFGYGIQLSGYNTSLHGLGAGLNSIRNCELFGNNQGIYLHYSVPGTLIDNCVLYSNRYSGIVDGTGIPNFGFPTIRNTLTAANGRYGHSSSIEGMIYQHCAFKDNVLNPYHSNAGDLTTAAEIDASAADGTNNIIPAADLALQDPAGGDFRPLQGSPLVDAGTETTPWATDVNGNPRLYGAAVDIGSCELHPPPSGTLILLR